MTEYGREHHDRLQGSICATYIELGAALRSVTLGVGCNGSEIEGLCERIKKFANDLDVSDRNEPNTVEFLASLKRR